jgi:hypothetical protein
VNHTTVYQWESRKRRPSPVLWQRVERLIDDASTRAVRSVMLAREARCEHTGRNMLRRRCMLRPMATLRWLLFLRGLREVLEGLSRPNYST